MALDEDEQRLRALLTVAVVSVILAAFLFTIVAPAFSDYRPTLAVDGPMLGLVAWLFNQRQRKDRDSE